VLRHLIAILETGVAGFPRNPPYRFANMPVGPADEEGTMLYYEDSGAPEGSQTYVTLVLVHGALFHGGIFHRIFPLAAARNLRIVTVNKRDYVGSSPYTHEELDALRGSIEKQKAVMEALGLQLAHFIAWFIDKEKVPRICDSGGETRASTGGFALAGWSAGNTVTFSLMANADKLPQRIRELFESYFRVFIAYDMPMRAAGEAFDYRIYSPWRDPALSYEDRLNIFGPWVSTYVAPIADLTGDVTMIAARKPLVEKESNRPVSTVARMSPEELASTTDMNAFKRSQMLVLGVDPSILRGHIHRAIIDCRFDIGAGEKKAIWPHLQVKTIWCDMTIGDVILWHWKLLENWKAARQLGNDGTRPLESIKFGNANHFPHWDDAERFADFLAETLGSTGASNT